MNTDLPDFKNETRIHELELIGFEYFSASISENLCSNKNFLEVFECLSMSMSVKNAER
jgi:hypothetical protein